jgi:hypothetical protein
MARWAPPLVGNPRQAHHLLSTGSIECALKKGGRWYGVFNNGEGGACRSIAGTGFPTFASRPTSRGASGLGLEAQRKGEGRPLRRQNAAGNRADQEVRNHDAAWDRGGAQCAGSADRSRRDVDTGVDNGDRAPRVRPLGGRDEMAHGAKALVGHIRDVARRSRGFDRTSLLPQKPTLVARQAACPTMMLDTARARF